MGTETRAFEEALPEMDYFHAPANAANIGRVEALRYAWRRGFLLRWVLLLWGFPCATVLMLVLMTEPWQNGVPRVMQGVGGIRYRARAVWCSLAWACLADTPKTSGLQGKGRTAPTGDGRNIDCPRPARRIALLTPAP